jgi:plasmid stabilization system protein ParE
MYKATWRKPALDDLARIVDYTKTEWGQTQATKLIATFEQATEALSESPKIGRKARRKNVYVFVLSRVPFVILYDFDGQYIFVNQVIHTSRRR